jgi:DNA polymerase-3 subunit gamma/tau
MLEKLEEPPPDVYFILCTTEPEKLLATVRSRCTLKKYFIKPLRRRDMKELIVNVLEQEEVKWKTDNISQLIKVADGIPREALILLDSLIDLRSKALAKALEEVVRVTSELPIELIRAVNGQESWKSIRSILRSMGEEIDVEDVRWKMLKYMRKVLLDNPSPEVAHTIECFEDSFAESGLAGLYLSCYKALNL